VLTELSTRRVLVTELVDGAAFGEVRTGTEDERDRVAEIVFRFYHDTARRIGVACGDPHPGNFLLARDGRVAFLDFGMVRHLPEGLWTREGNVYRALRDEDPAGVRAVMDDLGYLPPDWAFDDELLFAHLYLAGAWMFEEPQPRRLTAETGLQLMERMMALGPEWRRMLRAFSLPAEGLLIRRMENMVFGVAADLRASCDWRALSDELVAEEPARTPLGREHEAWLARA
jgi:predicted unusual protein kinase regulating ubiquinone biosynthesis (AarF/ABC1/UbiB family)